MVLIGISALWAIPEITHAQLYVGQDGTGSIGEYNATTGTAINASLITRLSYPSALALSGDELFVATWSNSTVGEYNATTGAAISANLITGLQIPAGLAVAPIPEPSAWSMIAIGGVALLGIMYRKKRRITQNAGVA
jgi:hypothetical protein